MTPKIDNCQVKFKFLHTHTKRSASEHEALRIAFNVVR